MAITAARNSPGIFFAPILLSKRCRRGHQRIRRNVPREQAERGGL